MFNLLPLEWRAGLAAGGLLLALGGIAGAGLYLHHQWYGDGYGAASVKYERLMADQAAANKAAIDGANKALIETADQLSKSNEAYDAVLSAIDTSAGGAGGDQPALDARRVHDLNAIR